MIRVLDALLAGMGLVAASPVFLVVCILCWMDTRSPLFFQQRVGRWQRPFTLIKFRTMRRGTASAATHLVDASAVTPLGRWLRRTKVDELPQLWNVLRGDMSLVGPRPCLPTQFELIAERERRGVFSARPGITGLAQITDIDMSTPALLAETDAAMLSSLTLIHYIKFIGITAFGGGRGDRVARAD